MFPFLLIVGEIRSVLFILFSLMLTLCILGDGSWFRHPVPGRGAVFLIALGVAALVLLCSVLIWLGSTRLSEDEREHLRERTVWFWAD